MCNGNFAGLTSLELEDESATVNVCSIAQGSLDDNIVLTKEHVGCTSGVGIGEGITVGEALVITKTGAAATTATGLTVTVTYILV